MKIADDTMIQAMTNKILSRSQEAYVLQQRVLILFGLNDDLCVCIHLSSSKLCNIQSSIKDNAMI